LGNGALLLQATMSRVARRAVKSRIVPLRPESKFLPFFPRHVIHLRRVSQNVVDCRYGMRVDVSVAEKSASAFDPPQPLVSGCRIIGLKAGDKTWPDLADAKGEIPAKVFLSGFIVGLDPSAAKLGNQPPTNVVSEADIIDEVVAWLRNIEGSAAKSNVRAHHTIL
jgi:hypothetical protein